VAISKAMYLPIDWMVWRYTTAERPAKPLGPLPKLLRDAYVSCRMNIDNQRTAADIVNRAIVGQYLLTHR
jgi:hypothetical protein